MYTQLDFNGRYYYYNIYSTTDYICMDVQPKKGDRILSLRQKPYSDLQHVRCDYYAEYQCVSDSGKLTATGYLDLSNLKNEARVYRGEVLGDWENQIRSVQCFWATGKNVTEETGLVISNASAPIVARDEVNVVSVTAYQR